jgi:glucose/arabinose dehydrogenase
MKNYNFIFGLFLILLFNIGISCTKNNSDKNNNLTPDEGNGGITLPGGFSALVVADNVGRGRHIVVNANGDIYVSLEQKNNNGGIAALRDNDSDGKADVIEYFGDYTGTGIGINKGHLYFGSDFEVLRYRLNENELLPVLQPEFIATGFVRERQHGAKTLAFDNAGNMYVNVGAPSNACQDPDRTAGVPGVDPCPILDYAGGIWQFKDDVPNQKQAEQGERYATGLRHCVAVTWNTADNKLYVVQHGRDQLSQFFPDLYDDELNAELPAEEFFDVEKGEDFGWPYCYYDQIKGKKVLAPEYGGDGEISGRCDNAKQPLIGFPGHIAPNDILFYTGDLFPERYKNGAFIAFHGSWNRAPREQKGYYVVFVPFSNGRPSGDWEIFADGFAGTDVINSPADAAARPCGLAQGPDGSLYVVDSKKGKIWRIFYQ